MGRIPIVGRSIRRVENLSFGKTPIARRKGALYLVACKDIVRVIEQRAGSVEDAASASEVKGMYNRVLRQDQRDWESVRQLLGEPDRAVCHLVAQWLLKLRDHLRAGEPLEEHLDGPLPRRLRTTLGAAVIALERAGFGMVARVPGHLEISGVGRSERGRAKGEGSRVD